MLLINPLHSIAPRLYGLKRVGDSVPRLRCSGLLSIRLETLFPVAVSGRSYSSKEHSDKNSKNVKADKEPVLVTKIIDVFDKPLLKNSLAKNTVYTRHIVDADDPLVQELRRGIQEGSRSALARAITLVESVTPRRRAQAQALLRDVLSDIRQRQKHSLFRVSSFRIGLSGPPGAGKSTHIEALGKLLTSRGHKVAVLAVDPSSSTTGGSLLGDKTRMPELSCDPNAYIRPSPASGNLGGVTRVTNDAIVLCEGAGYDIILVETVGVGQSEFAVAEMVDVFELLIPPAGGDELQGIKKGIVEVADFVVINKCDGDLVPAARRIQSEYTSALKFVRAKTKHWKPVVMGVSSVTRQGLPELWEKMEDFRSKLTLSGDLERRREKQHVLWMRNQIRDNILQLFNEHPAVKQLTPKLEFLVEKGALTPGYAADILLYQFSASMATADVKISQPVADEVLAAGKELVNELRGKDD